MMGYGYIKQYIDIYYGKNVKVFDFIKNCFEKLKILVKTTLLLCLKCTIPVIILLYLARLFINFVLNVLFLLGASIGLIKIIMILIYMLIFGVCVEVLLKYMFVNNELAHSANLTAKEIMNNSVENMKGNKLRMTGYYLITFIAFAFVYFICSLIGTLGTIIMLAIYLLTFIPFIQFLFVIFYEDIRSTKMSNVSLVNNRNEEEDFELQDPIQNI